MNPPSLTFTVDGTPAPQGSKKAYNRGGRTILVESSKKLPAWRAKITATSHAAMHRTNTTPARRGEPVTINLTFRMPRPKAWGKNRHDPMTQRPDVDKLARAVLDALTGPIMQEDSQVTHLTATKQRTPAGTTPGCDITVTYPNRTA